MRPTMWQSLYASFPTVPVVVPCKSLMSSYMTYLALQIFVARMRHIARQVKRACAETLPMSSCCVAVFSERGKDGGGGGGGATLAIDIESMTLLY